MMPGMDGLEVCRQVRGNEIINHIPIIVVTAKITEAERIEGIEAGADAYLSKPFSAEELTTRAEQLLAGRRLLQEKFAKVSVELRKGEEHPAELTKEREADLRFLAKVTSVVHAQLSKNKNADVSAIASNMCMSPRQFHRKINALTGYSPSVWTRTPRWDLGTWQSNAASIPIPTSCGHSRAFVAKLHQTIASSITPDGTLRCHVRRLSLEAGA